MCSASLFAVYGGSLAIAQQVEQTLERFEEEESSRGETRLRRIVTGAGEDKVAVDTPQAVTVLTYEDLETIQPTTVGDVFDEVPGVNTQGSESILGESFNIRGVGSGEDQADEGRFRILVDNVRKRFQQYRIGGFFADADVFSRVEVLRGPAASILYGPGAFAGIVRMESKAPAEFLKEDEYSAIRLKAAWETNGDGVFKSALGAWRPDESAEFMIYGARRSQDDYKVGDGMLISDTTPYEKWPFIDAEGESQNFLAKGVLHFGDDMDRHLTLSYSRWNTEAENQQYAQTTDSTGFGRVDRTVTDETLFVRYEDENLDNDLIDFRVQFSFSDTLNEESNASFFQFSPFIPPFQFFPDSDIRYESYQADVRNTSTLSGDNWVNYLTYGVQYEHHTRTKTHKAVAPQSRNSAGAQPNGIEETLGFFAHSEFIYDDRLTITPGVRFDRRRLSPDQHLPAALNGGIGFDNGAEVDIDTALSYSLTGSYEFNENLSVFASYSHTERFATIDEVFDFRTGAVPGYDTDPERSDNYEAGFAYSAYDTLIDGDSFQFKTTVFQNNISDYIARNLYTSTGARVGSAFVNVGDVRLEGVELEMAYDSEYLFASGGYSKIRGHDLDFGLSNSGSLNTVPADELFFTFGAKLPDYGVSLGWKYKHVSDQDLILGSRDRLNTRNVFGRQPTEAYETHGAFINWVPPEGPLEGLEIRASVENIFDEQYKDFLMNDPGKGRTFKFSIAQRIGFRKQ